MNSGVAISVAIMSIVLIINSDCRAQERFNIGRWQSCAPDGYTDLFNQYELVEYMPKISGQVVNCLVDEGRYADAIDYLNLAIELDSSSVIDQLPNRQLLAEVYELSGQQHDAENQWVDLIRSFSDDSDLHRDILQELRFNIGNFFLRNGRSVEAKEVFYESTLIVSKYDQVSPYYLNNLRALLAVLEYEGDSIESVIIANKIARAVRYGVFVGVFGKDEMIRASDDLARVQTQLR